MPNDAQRIAYLKLLIDAKCEDKILISHDINTKDRLVSIQCVSLQGIIYYKVKEYSFFIDGN